MQVQLMQQPTRPVQRLVAALALVVAAILPATSAAADMPRLQVRAGIHVVQAEVAHTFDTRARGLMFRKSMGPNQGMLFVFQENAAHCMWMRNTLIPLAVAFLDANGTIINVEEMQPQTENSHCAARPAKYALEMNAGWFAQKGVRPGTQLGGIDRAPPAQ